MPNLSAQPNQMFLRWEHYFYILPLHPGQGVSTPSGERADRDLLVGWKSQPDRRLPRLRVVRRKTYSGDKLPFLGSLDHVIYHTLHKKASLSRQGSTMEADIYRALNPGSKGIPFSGGTRAVHGHPEDWVRTSGERAAFDARDCMSGNLPTASRKLAHSDCRRSMGRWLAQASSVSFPLVSGSCHPTG